jgi:hypothetical protein
MYEQNSKTAIEKTMPGDAPTVGSVTAHSLGQDEVKPTKWTGLSPFEMLFGRPPL